MRSCFRARRFLALARAAGLRHTLDMTPSTRAPRPPLAERLALLDVFETATPAAVDTTPGPLPARRSRAARRATKGRPVVAYVPTAPAGRGADTWTPKTCMCQVPNRGRLLTADEVALDLFCGQRTGQWVRETISFGNRAGHRTVLWYELDVINWIDARANDTPRINEEAAG